MLKPFMNPLLRASLAIAVLSSPCAFAGEDDFTKKVELSSDYQDFNGISKKAIYKGNVVIKQGSLEVKANEMEMDASKGEGKEIFIATGNPATYSQQQEDGSRVTAKANRIEYRRDNRSLSLKGNAEIVQNTSSVKGESILFNITLEQIIAQGNDQNSGRVITTFQPEPKAKDDEKEKQP